MTTKEKILKNTGTLLEAVGYNNEPTSKEDFEAAKNIKQ